MAIYIEQNNCQPNNIKLFKLSKNNLWSSFIGLSCAKLSKFYKKLKIKTYCNLNFSLKLIKHFT